MLRSASPCKVFGFNDEDLPSTPRIRHFAEAGAESKGVGSPRISAGADPSWSRFRTPSPEFLHRDARIAMPRPMLPCVLQPAPNVQLCYEAKDTDSGSRTPWDDSSSGTPWHDSGSVTPWHDSGSVTPWDDSSSGTPWHDSGSGTPWHDAGSGSPWHLCQATETKLPPKATDDGPGNASPMLGVPPPPTAITTRDDVVCVERKDDSLPGGCKSNGSHGHPYTCAPACKYFVKKRGCKDGAGCDHCHECVWVSRRRRERLSDRRANVGKQRFGPSFSGVAEVKVAAAVKMLTKEW